MKITYRLIQKINHYFLKRKVTNRDYCYGLNKSEKRQKKIIISMTTFPKRIKNLDLCIKSILFQTVKPDMFIIYLGNDCSNQDVKYLESKYKKYGVIIKLDSTNNYYSHKKYIYSMTKFKNDLVITIDDDLIYPSNMIESLIDCHKNNPNCICARRVHLMEWDNMQLKKYKDWKFEFTHCSKPSHNLFATTGAGTLFPPNSLPNCAFDFDLIKEYALFADDIWLKCMSVLNNTKVVWAKNKIQMPPTINNSQAFSLYNNNVLNEQNDLYINNIFNNFGITKDNFYNEEN